jgi:hypothetical protein
MMLLLKQVFSFKNYVFIPAFFALYFLSIWLPGQSFDLTIFRGDMIGIATLQNIDINARISLFYKAMLLLFVLFAMLGLIFAFVTKNIKDKQVLKMLNTLAFIGISLLFLQLFLTPVGLSVSIIITLMFWLVLFALSGIKRKDKYLEFIWLIVLAFAVTFLFRFILINTGLDSFLNHIEIIYSLAIALLMAIYLLIISKPDGNINRIIKASAPLLLIPMLGFLSDEIYLILNQHGIFFLSASIFYVLILIILLLIAFLIYRRSIQSFHIKTYLSRFVYPVTLLGLVVFVLYSPIWEQTPEMFESANHANAVMQWLVFGKIPILETQTSHLLADYSFEFIYTFFNGYDASLSFYNYRFLHGVLVILSAYYFLGKVFDDYLFSFVFLLFFPFVTILLGNMAISLVTPILFYRLYRHYSFKNLVVYLAFLVLLLFWRPDVGVANLIGGSMLLLIYFIGHREKYFDLLKAIAIIIAVVLIPTMIIIWAKDIDLFSHIHQSLDYFGAGQAHGYSEITRNIDRYYLFHYFVFPIITLGIAGYFGFMLFRHKKETSFFTVAILFISIYYFANAQRGLVRHSLYEGSDMFFSSFIFLILGLLAVYLFKFKKSWLVFPVVIILLIVNFKFPDSFGNQNLLASENEVFVKPDILPKYNNKITRVIALPEEERSELYGDFKLFLDNNFEAGNTFLDFSNTPMLYFYTQRPVPSYFNQYMQNTVTGYLQDENIKMLQNYNVPIVVFSHKPTTWLDKTDGVFNTLRYFKISRYIYQNYKPYGTLNNYYLWIKKGLEIKDASIDLNADFAFNEVKQKLKKFPHLLGLQKYESQKEVLKLKPKGWKNNKMVYSIDEPLESDQTFLKLTVNSKSSNSLPLYIKYKRGKSTFFELSFTLFANEEAEYIVPLSWIYTWYLQKGNRLLLYSKDTSKIEIKSISIVKIAQ